MKKRYVAATLLLTLLVAGAYLYFSGTQFTLRLAEATLQKKLSEKLPLSKTYFYLVQVTFDNPRVDLIDGSKRVNAGIDVALNFALKDDPEVMAGAIDVSAAVAYEAEEGAFYLVDPVVEQMTFPVVPERHRYKMNVALTKALAWYYQENPIYELKPSDTKQAITRMVLKDIEISQSELVLTLGLGDATKR